MISTPADVKCTEAFYQGILLADAPMWLVLRHPSRETTEVTNFIREATSFFARYSGVDGGTGSTTHGGAAVINKDEDVFDELVRKRLREEQEGEAPQLSSALVSASSAVPAGAFGKDLFNTKVLLTTTTTTTGGAPFTVKHENRKHHGRGAVRCRYEVATVAQSLLLSSPAWYFALYRATEASATSTRQVGRASLSPPPSQNQGDTQTAVKRYHVCFVIGEARLLEPSAVGDGGRGAIKDVVRKLRAVLASAFIESSDVTSGASLWHDPSQKVRVSSGGSGGRSDGAVRRSWEWPPDSESVWRQSKLGCVIFPDRAMKPDGAVDSEATQQHQQHSFVAASQVTTVMSTTLTVPPLAGNTRAATARRALPSSYGSRAPDRFPYVSLEDFDDIIVMR